MRRNDLPMIRTATSLTAAALFGLIFVTACRTTQGVAEDRAHVVHPTPEGREAIAQVVSQAFSGARAILDEDAVTDDGVRVIDPSQLRGTPRLAIAGRAPIDPGRTERFHLVRSGERCVLVHDRSDRHYELTGTACAPR
jgi:predicted small secreted protein